MGQKPLLPMEGFVRFEQIIEHYPVNKSQLDQEVSDGLFPEQIKKGRPVFWDAATIRMFLKSKGATLGDGPRLPTGGFIRLKQILRHYPVSNSYLYAEIMKGTFPRQRLHRGRVAMWDIAEFREFLLSKGAILS